MRKKKRRLIGLVCIIFILCCVWPVYKSYRVMNVMDEMNLSLHAILPYTKTDLKGLDFRSEKMEMAEQDLCNDLGIKSWIRKGMEDYAVNCKFTSNKEMRITCIFYRLGNVRVELICNYNFWNKELTPCLYVKRYREGHERDEPINDRAKNEERARQLLAEAGMTEKEAAEVAGKEIANLFDEWIESNNGKSKFTKENYGTYKIGQLQIETYSDEEW